MERHFFEGGGGSTDEKPDLRRMPGFARAGRFAAFRPNLPPPPREAFHQVEETGRFPGSRFVLLSMPSQRAVKPSSGSWGLAPRRLSRRQAFPGFHPRLQLRGSSGFSPLSLRTISCADCQRQAMQSVSRLSLIQIPGDCRSGEPPLSIGLELPAELHDPCDSDISFLF